MTITITYRHNNGDTFKTKHKKVISTRLENESLCLVLGPGVTINYPIPNIVDIKPRSIYEQYCR